MNSGTAPSAPSSYTVTVPPWTNYRTLDPVRAAALHEAVKAVAPWPEDRLMVDSILVVAEAFERWLAGTDKEHP